MVVQNTVPHTHMGISTKLSVVTLSLDCWAEHAKNKHFHFKECYPWDKMNVNRTANRMLGREQECAEGHMRQIRSWI